MKTELFTEFCGCYYQAVSQILKSASAVPISESEMAEIIGEHAFSESALSILPKLISGEWDLLAKAEEKHFYKSKVVPLTELPLSAFQKRWLKAILQDPCMRLFLEQEQLEEVERLLSGISPLFLQEDFYYYDRYMDGDPYDSRVYRKNFNVVLQALKLNRLIRVAYRPSKGSLRTGCYLPLRLEYSQKDDKFRLYAVTIQRGRIASGVLVLNLGRVQNAQDGGDAGCTVDKDGLLDHYFRHVRGAEPVTLRIYEERNAMERCMLHFASFEKRTERDERTGTYKCELYYDKNDETELLIQILSFGPAIQVLGPAGFLKQLRQRVARQYQLNKASDPLA